jgi:hypothetical protein
MTTNGIDNINLPVSPRDEHFVIHYFNIMDKDPDHFNQKDLRSIAFVKKLRKQKHMYYPADKRDQFDLDIAENICEIHASRGQRTLQAHRDNLQRYIEDIDEINHKRYKYPMMIAGVTTLIGVSAMVMGAIGSKRSTSKSLRKLRFNHVIGKYSSSSTTRSEYMRTFLRHPRIIPDVFTNDLRLSGNDLAANIGILPLEVIDTNRHKINWSLVACNAYTLPEDVLRENADSLNTALKSHEGEFNTVEDVIKFQNSIEKEYTIKLDNAPPAK